MAIEHEDYFVLYLTATSNKELGDLENCSGWLNLGSLRVFDRYSAFHLLFQCSIVSPNIIGNEILS